MYYFVCARSDNGGHATKFGYAEHEGTLRKRIANAEVLLSAHGYGQVVLVQHGPGDRKFEGAVHRSFRHRFGRPPSGPHGDGASECYIGADLLACVNVLAENGLGLLAGLKVVALEESEAAAHAEFAGLLIEGMEQFDKAGSYAKGRDLSRTIWTWSVGLGLALPCAGLYLTLANATPGGDVPNYSPFAAGMLIWIVIFMFYRAQLTEREDALADLVTTASRLKELHAVGIALGFPFPQETAEMLDRLSGIG